MEKTQAGAKLDVQMEMLEAVAPELVAEVRRLSAIVVAVTAGLLSISDDTNVARMYNVSKYTQGRVDAGDNAVRVIEDALMTGRG